ncbi:ABC transporter substrate-binding protein [Lusitaniella coriacea]|uniref:ABC transporter substrate-binding protein n=1 Tax=Lusitaniella coriacea TaxID=1983105 RepID=UPI003CF8B75F
MKFWSSLQENRSFWSKWCWKVRKQIVILPFALLFSLSLLTSCNTAPASPLRVAINPWPGYETLYLARSLGHYENTPIELIDFPSAAEEMRAYRNGNVEAMASTLDQALTLATTQSDVRIVTIMDFSEGGDVILAKPEILNLKALKGKRVGVEASALGAYTISRALELADLTPKDIEVVSLRLSEHERAFKDGEIDAVVTFGAARTRILETGAKQIFDSSQIPGEIVDTLVVRQSVLETQSEASQALVKGHFEAREYLKKHPQESAERVAPRTQITPEQFLESFEGLRSPDIQENQTLLGGENPLLLKTARRLVAIMMDNDLLSKPVDPANLLDDRLVKAL